MNKHLLKIIRDNLPEPVKYITASLFRNKLIKNEEYLRIKDLLSKRESLSKAEIEQYQFNELKKILIHSYENVPYYTELFNQVKFSPYEIISAKEIDIIPFLTKEIIRDNFDKLISTKKISRGHYMATTGGSTGEPLKILLDYDCVFKENAFIDHYFEKLGYQTKDRFATFRGVSFGDKLWKFNPMYNELIFSPFKLSSKTVSTYVDKINKIKPDYLHGYLSSLVFLARLMAENNLKLEKSLKGIFLISESIDKNNRDFLESFFHTKSLTYYGHSERCIIAEEIKPNEYAFDPYYGYTELIKSKDSGNDIIGTGFLNKTMPLIRYKTNDICYSNNEYFMIDGRWKGSMGLLGINNEFVSHAAFNFHSEIFKNVTSYQFVQKQKGKADLLLVVNQNFKAEEIKLMNKEIDKKTKGVIEFNIKVTDQLILTNRGKYKMFISDFEA